MFEIGPLLPLKPNCNAIAYTVILYNYVLLTLLQQFGEDPHICVVICPQTFGHIVYIFHHCRDLAYLIFTFSLNDWIGYVNIKRTALTPLHIGLSWVARSCLTSWDILNPIYFFKPVWYAEFPVLSFHRHMTCKSNLIYKWGLQWYCRTLMKLDIPRAW